jgi:hypothetical protein
MPGRALKVVGAATIGFFVSAGAILLYWWSGFDSRECEGETCGLEFAAIVSGALLTGLLVGAVTGFATYVLTRRSTTD